MLRKNCSKYLLNHTDGSTLQELESSRRGRLIQKLLGQTYRDQKTLLNQNRSPLLKLPAELRNKIYEFAFSNTVYIEADSLVIDRTLNSYVPKKRGREPSFATRSRKDYRGVFALSYTCKQIHHEASWALIARNLLFDLTDNSNVYMSASQLGTSAADVRAIRISSDEAFRITDWFVRGATNSNGDSNHYAMGLFPSLSYIEVVNDPQDPHHSFAEMNKAFQFCFDKKSLDNHGTKRKDGSLEDKAGSV